MEDPFVQRIAKLQQEVLALKTCPIKTCTQFATITKPVNLTFTLTLPPGGFPTYAYSTKKAIITAVANENMVTMCTLKNNAGDVTNYNLSGRTLRISPYQCGSTTIYSVVVYSRSSADIQDVLDGKTVTLNYTVEITASSDMTISTTYEDYYDE